MNRNIGIRLCQALAAFSPSRFVKPCFFARSYKTLLLFSSPPQGVWNDTFSSVLPASASGAMTCRTRLPVISCGPKVNLSSLE